MKNNTMKNTMLDCKTCKARLLDLLTEEGAPAQRARVREHLADCGACSAEFRELESTFALLDEWAVPEPSAFFDTRLHARLREAQQAEPAGVWERLAAWWNFSSNQGVAALRPAMAGALALVLLVGGGTFASFRDHVAGPQQAVNGQSSAAVNDLRILDNNQEALQQMDQLLDDRNDASAQDGPTT